MQWQEWTKYLTIIMPVSPFIFVTIWEILRIYGPHAIITAASMPYGLQYVQEGLLISCRDAKVYCVPAAVSRIQKRRVSDEISVGKFK